jgi:hypothetical protein
LLLRIPSVSTTTEEWAAASAPYVDGTSASIKLPPAGAQVWVEFEAGNPAVPVWIGWKVR